MSQVPIPSGYRIGPFPRRNVIDTHRSTRRALVLAIVVVAWLVGFVVVLKQGVERGQQIRASLAAPTFGAGPAASQR